MQTEPCTQQLSLMTYNIHKGFGIGKIRFLLPQMKEALLNCSPDLLFLQEVIGRHDSQSKLRLHWPEGTQCDFIAENTWPYTAYAQNANYRNGHHGNAILSKYPLDNEENINFSQLSRASRSLLHLELRLGTQVIHLLCVHLGLFKEEQSKQLDRLIERIKLAIPDESPLLLAGDFNDWRSQLNLQLEEELQLKEAFKEAFGEHAKSFPAMSPALKTDRIYYRGLNLIHADCLKGKPWRTLSDHLPLYARFELIYP